MAEQLVSVRLSSDVIEKLRALADINESNVAEEIRISLQERLDRLASSDEFREEANAAIERAKVRMSRLLETTG